MGVGFKCTNYCSANHTLIKNAILLQLFESSVAHPAPLVITRGAYFVGKFRVCILSMMFQGLSCTPSIRRNLKRAARQIVVLVGNLQIMLLGNSLTVSHKGADKMRRQDIRKFCLACTSKILP